MNELNTEVLIIGAGVSGLAAARKLSDAGCDVLVIEGRNRIRGRIHSIHDPEWMQAVEAGAEFIHGNPRETWDIIKQFDLTAEAIPQEFREFVNGQLQKSDFDQSWDKVISRITQLKDDKPFAEFLSTECSDFSDKERENALSYVQGFDAADPNLVSSKWIASSEEVAGGSGENSRIRNGYDALTYSIASNPFPLAVILNRIAKEIRWSKGRANVLALNDEGQMETYNAKACIITLPLGVLQQPHSKAGVSFFPEPESVIQAIEKLKIGSVLKVLLLFKEAFWLRDSSARFTFVRTPDFPIGAWWSAEPSTLPLLTGWCGGPKAEKLSSLKQSEIIESSLKILGTVFSRTDAELQSLLTKSLVCNWENDPFSLGAYSYLPAVGIEAVDVLTAPVEDTLYFAGEATEKLMTGTVAGAIASGYRAANLYLKTK
jgi:monoamine oxidase